jgi:hypothetical protein
MQFKVPQFLDIEDKIFGPFTFRQFVYLAGGAGLAFVFYRLFGLILGLIPILVVVGLAGALAFYRPNNKPFINMLESVLKYFLQDKLYVWKKRMVAVDKKVGSESEVGRRVETRNPAYQAMSGERLSGNKLRDLAWSLDVLDLNKENQGK